MIREREDHLIIHFWVAASMGRLLSRVVGKKQVMSGYERGEIVCEHDLSWAPLPQAALDSKDLITSISIPWKTSFVKTR